jgi:hypothetical protein
VLIRPILRLESSLVPFKGDSLTVAAANRSRQSALHPGGWANQGVTGCDEMFETSVTMETLVHGTTPACGKYAPLFESGIVV